MRTVYLAMKEDDNKKHVSVSDEIGHFKATVRNAVL